MIINIRILRGNSKKLKGWAERLKMSELKILEEYATSTYYDEDGVCVDEGDSTLIGYAVANEKNEVIRTFSLREDAEAYIKRWEFLKKGKK